MRRQVCPELQIDIFDADTMHQLFAHPAPEEPLPALPFERNKDVDTIRASKMLATSGNTIRRMLDDNLIRHYQIRGGIYAREYRIEHASVVEYCDKLRLKYGISPRRASKGPRPPDSEILPFPANETINVGSVMGSLDVSRKVAINLIESGELIGYKLVPLESAPWRIHRPSLVAYLQKLRRDASTPMVAVSPR
jgi:hypothetical protein